MLGLPQSLVWPLETADDDGARIGPTAHYTADVWVRSGLSDPVLSTPLGAVLHTALLPFDELYGRLSGRPSLDAMLLARHRAIDRLLEQEIAAGRVGQVIEIAAGLSGRSCRFARRFSDVRYVETDLPDMAARKRRLLDAAGLRGPNHEVRTVDALAHAGPTSLDAVAAVLDASRGLAIISEGLLSYLRRDDVLALWRRVAATLRRFPHGIYLSDLHLAGDVDGMWVPELFRVGLGIFARGPVRYHFTSAGEAARALRAAGFGRARVDDPRDVVGIDRPEHDAPYAVRVLAATTSAP
jgi:O-methyltransferase involved in polyketide biosynthesis